MIDVNTGQIIISDIIKIKYNDFRHHILSLNIGQTNKQWDHGNGWSWLQENNVFVNNKYFIIQFGFFETKLKEMRLVVSDLKFNIDVRWEEWSEEKELADLKEYKLWLKDELGTQREFDWGSVWASYDMKGGSSSIGIRYK